jgi:hypothetical protein
MNHARLSPFGTVCQRSWQETSRGSQAPSTIRAILANIMISGYGVGV